MLLSQATEAFQCLPTGWELILRGTILTQYAWVEDSFLGGEDSSKQRKVSPAFLAALRSAFKGLIVAVPYVSFGELFWRRAWHPGCFNAGLFPYL